MHAVTHRQKSGVTRIAGRLIGSGQRPYIVAEMSGNHNGDLSRAFQILNAAAEAGADAVKIQSYRADTITIDHHGPEFILEGGLWHGRRLYDLYEQAHTPWDWHKALFKHAKKIGITLFSSPFDHTAVDLLKTLNAPAYKIASPELIDLPLIRYVAQTGKPIIMSTGMASFEEIGEAIEMARQSGATQLIVLHCTSAYPTPPEDVNLATMAAITKEFDVIVGLSDHSRGTSVAALAVALGAKFIEKHFTLARSDGGVDSAFSIEPDELADLVATSTMAYKSIGSPTFKPVDSEQAVFKNRRSLYIVAPVLKGQTLDRSNVRSIRPGFGLKPKYLDKVIGCKASRDLSFGEPLNRDMIAGWSKFMKAVSSNIAIITARGGSKRIHRKNIRLFRNKPMLVWSIEAALQSELFARVMVSTDDLEIAKIAKMLWRRCTVLENAKDLGRLFRHY